MRAPETRQLVKSYQLSGAGTFEEIVRARIATYVGQMVGSNDLQALKGWIFELYRARAGALATVGIDLTPSNAGSVLRVVIRMPIVRRMEVTGEAGVKDSIVQSIREAVANDIPTGQPLDLLRLDNRITELRGRYPVSMRAKVQPAGDGVDVDLVVTTAPWTPLKPEGAQLSVNNGGLSSYGREQFTGDVAVNGFTPGSILEARTMLSPGVSYGWLGYNVPLWYAGGRLLWWGSDLHTKTVGSQSGLASGQLAEMGAEFSRLHYIERDIAWNSGYGVKFDWVSDYVRSAVIDDKRVRILYLREGLSRGVADIFQYGDQLRAGAPFHATEWDVSTQLSSGWLDLSGNAQNLLLDQGGANSAGRFFKLEWSANGVWQPVSSWPWAIAGRLSGQLSSANLDSSQKFAAGGPQAVRGYSSADGVGDEGMVASVAMRFYPSSRVQVGPFVDVGWIRTSHQPYGTNNLPNCYSLQAWGVAFDVKAPHRINVGGSVAKSFGSAAGLNSSSSETHPGDWRVWLTASIQF